MDLKQGLLLYQYRVASDYEWLKISIQYNGKHVAQSPYKVGPVLHENCACPLRSYQEWLEDFQCSEVDEQIVEDLKPFQEEGINITRLYERGGELFSRVSFIHYSIVDSKVSNNLHVPEGGKDDETYRLKYVFESGRREGGWVGCCLALYPLSSLPLSLYTLSPILLSPPSLFLSLSLSPLSHSLPLLLIFSFL